MVVRRWRARGRPDLVVPHSLELLAGLLFQVFDRARLPRLVEVHGAEQPLEALRELLGLREEVEAAGQHVQLDHCAETWPERVSRSSRGPTGIRIAQGGLLLKQVTSMPGWWSNT